MLRTYFFKSLRVQFEEAPANCVQVAYSLIEVEVVSCTGDQNHRFYGR